MAIVAGDLAIPVGASGLAEALERAGFGTLELEPSEQRLEATICVSRLPAAMRFRIGSSPGGV